MTGTHSEGGGGAGRGGGGAGAQVCWGFLATSNCVHNLTKHFSNIQTE